MATTPDFLVVDVQPKRPRPPEPWQVLFALFVFLSAGFFVLSLLDRLDPGRIVLNKSEYHCTVTRFDHLSKTVVCDQYNRNP